MTLLERTQAILHAMEIATSSFEHNEMEKMEAAVHAELAKLEAGILGKIAQIKNAAPTV